MHKIIALLLGTVIAASSQTAQASSTQRHCHWKIDKATGWYVAKPCRDLPFGGNGDGLPF
jgi:hypothetical protein